MVGAIWQLAVDPLLSTEMGALLILHLGWHKTNEFCLPSTFKPPMWTSRPVKIFRRDSAPHATLLGLAWLGSTPSVLPHLSRPVGGYFEPCCSIKPSQTSCIGSSLSGFNVYCILFCVIVFTMFLLQFCVLLFAYFRLSQDLVGTKGWPINKHSMECHTLYPVVASQILYVPVHLI